MTRTLGEARALFATEATSSVRDLVWDRAYIETDRAWLVLYNSREYYETGNSLSGLAGSVGLYVPKDALGRPEWLASTPSPEEQLRQRGDDLIDVHIE
jgi:hypothetical protein